MDVTIDAATFPQITIDASWGQWWRIHNAARGPWYFASSDTPGRQPAAIGRFDLPSPDGTCYLGEYLGGTVPESIRVPKVTAQQAQAAANDRRLSQMPLDRWYAKPIADFTSPDVTTHNAPLEIAGVSRAQARPWAEAAWAAGLHGILYRLGQDPEGRRGLALFLGAGEHAPHTSPTLPTCRPGCGMRSSTCSTASTAATRCRSELHVSVAATPR